MSEKPTISEAHDVLRMRELVALSVESNIEVRLLLEDFRNRARSFVKAHGGNPKLLTEKQRESVDFLFDSAIVIEKAIRHFDLITSMYEARFLQMDEFVRKAKVLRKISELEDKLKNQNNEYE